MQESIAPIMIEVAAPAADYATQAATYAAADAGIFAATQAAAQQSVASAAELVKSSGEAAMSAGEVALIAAEAAGATVMATAAGLALPVILGGVGIAGLAGAGYYAWTRKGWTVAGVRQQISNRMAKAQAPGEWPEWNGYTDDAIWNDLDLLEAATRPEPSADELELSEINWDELALECAA